MLDEIGSFLHDACEVLLADRSDWLPDIQYVGFAKGVLSAGDGLFSLGHTFFGRKRETWRGIALQTTQGKLHAASGGLLIWSSLRRPQSMYSCFMIDAFINMLTAFIDYVGVRIAVPLQESDSSRIYNMPPGQRKKEHDAEVKKAEKLLIAKGLALACWTLARFLYPSVLLFVATAAVYLSMAYQHAKPLLRNNTIPEDVYDDERSPRLS